MEGSLKLPDGPPHAVAGWQNLGPREPDRGAPPRPGPRYARVFGIVLALVVAIAALAVYLTAPRGAPASRGPERSGSPFIILYEQVGAGQVNVTFPLMEARNPDNASVKNISFRTDMDFSSGPGGMSEVNYSWMGRSDSGLPVVIVYDPQAVGFLAGPNWLVLTPGGSCIDSCSMSMGWIGVWSNTTFLALQQMYVMYTVYRATLVQPEGSYSWLEVRYRFGSAVLGTCDAGAFCWTDYNVTEPTAQDLEVIGPPLVINVYSGVGQVTPFDVHDWVDPSRIFHTTFPGPAFKAGVYGSIRTSLRSSFAWGSASDEVFAIIGAGNVTMELFIDTRFGNLYPVLLS